MNGVTEFLIALGINIATALLIVCGIYYPQHRSKKYVFSFVSFNLIIFFVVSMMARVEMSLGVGFGLFAIFSVLRYRTNPIPVREMTYLFIIAALPVMHAAGATGSLWAQLLIADGVVVVVLYLLEKEWGFAFESSRKVTYDNISLLHPQHRSQLIEDLENRTGLEIKRLEIGSINLLRDTARIKIIYDPSQQPVFTNPSADPIHIEDQPDLLFTL